MAIKILIVDPSDQWLEEAQKYFVESMYKVDIANNGKEAQLKIFNEQYFAVILNLDVKEHSGIQVMKFIKSNHPAQTVLLTMLEDWVQEGTLTEKDLRRLGITDYLVHPFELKDLKDLVEGQQSVGQMISILQKKDGVSEEEEVDLVDENFTKVKINEFISCKNVLFNIYIRIRDGKYIKILHEGDSFSKERFDKYRNDKKVEYLYFLSTDRRKYIRYANHIGLKLIKNTKVAPEVKMKMIKNSTEKMIEDLYSEGIKPVAMDQAKQVCNNIYEMVSTEKNLFKLLRSYQDFDPSAYSHSYLVSLFGSMIIKQFDWESKLTLETLCLGAFFHDIGKMKLPKELLELRPIDMTDEQYELYQTHPTIGAEMIMGNRMVSPSVVQIVLQHHESVDGTGFPSGLKQSKISTLAKIIKLANDFSRMVQEREALPVVCLKEILQDRIMVNKYNPIVLEKFIQIFADPAKIKKEANMMPSNSSMVPTNKKAS